MIDYNSIIDYIYKIRYLKYLPVSKNKLMKDIVDFKDLEKNTINIDTNFIRCLENL